MKTRVLYVRLPEQLHERLRRYCETRGVTLNRGTADLLTTALTSGADAECMGCDRRGLDVRQMPNGDLVCRRCERVVARAAPLG